MIAKNQVWQNKQDANDLILIKQNYHKAVTYSKLNDDTVETMSTYVLTANYQCVGQDGIKLDDDMVNNPPHYQDESGVECIEITKHMQFCGGNCFKYLYRAGMKGDFKEDLKKSIWYAERAWIMNEWVPSSIVYDLIHEVAKYRNQNIARAMLCIASNSFKGAEKALSTEIKRLENTDD